MNAELQARPGDEIDRRLVELEGVEVEAPSPDRAGNGSRVRVLDLKTGEDDVFTLVPGEEVDPDAGDVSLASPIGQALLGRKAGETVRVATPRGERTLAVLCVTPDRRGSARSAAEEQ